MITAKLLTVASLEVNSDAFFGGWPIGRAPALQAGVSGSSPLFSF